MKKKNKTKTQIKKNMTMKVFFFSSVWKIRFSVNIVNAVSKEKTWLKQRYVSVKFKIIGIKVVKKNSRWDVAYFKIKTLKFFKNCGFYFDIIIYMLPAFQWRRHFLKQNTSFIKAVENSALKLFWLQWYELHI